MKHIVLARHNGIVHFYATCSECDWSFENYLDRNKGYSEIRKHVRKTGHTIYLEKGTATTYMRENDI